jgi:hypothetical protein
MRLSGAIANLTGMVKSSHFQTFAARLLPEPIALSCVVGLEVRKAVVDNRAAKAHDFSVARGELDKHEASWTLGLTLA